MGNKDSIRIKDENWSNIPEGDCVSEVPLVANLHLVILGLQVLEVGIVQVFSLLCSLSVWNLSSSKKLLKKILNCHNLMA